MELHADSSRVYCPSERTRRLFPLEEANRSLVLVRRVVDDLVNEHALLLELQEIIESTRGPGDAPCRNAAHDQMLRSVDKLQVYLEELACIGVELRDWSLGVVDFPSTAGQREIRLCWQCGQQTVAFWHEVDAGCQGRRSIESLGILTAT